MSCLMVMAGGTGGHVFPALAVANELKTKGVRVVWLGTRKGLEASVVPANNIEIEWITINGLRGKSIISWLLAPFRLIRAMWQSRAAIKRVAPDCVLGMGGFVAGPGGLMSRLLGTPLIIHEQNAVAGLTNQYLAKIANRVLTGFPKVAGLPAHAAWVGNPVRKNIVLTDGAEQNKGINLLVIGGSQGALAFNKYLPVLLAEQSKALDITVWHQTGKGRHEQVVHRYQQLSMPTKVTEFIDDMSDAYLWADLVICRAGAMTISELCAAGKPALLIPYPYSAGDHQDRNAEFMVNAGAAELINEKEINNRLLDALNKLCVDKNKLLEMGINAQKLHKPNALQHVVLACEEYLNA